VKVEIFSDIACPWCYVGKKRFERALSEFEGKDEVEVAYRPFQLDPTLPVEPERAVPATPVLEARFGPGLKSAHQRLEQLGAPLGIDFQWNKVLLTNTLKAHRLVWQAERAGGAELQARVKEALLKANFTDGVNLADDEALGAIAAANGLPASTDGEAEVRAMVDTARQLGITGVPTFVFDGKYAVSGAQEVATFLNVLREVAANAAS
jgi:predicted DsbA family dithiol-disulfide isomerase